MRLTDLEPRWRPMPDGPVDGRLTFTCPACRKGVIAIDVVLGGPDPILHAHGANVLPPDWDRLTISPSIADEGLCTAKNRGCSGWHGFITNGEIR